MVHKEDSPQVDNEIEELLKLAGYVPFKDGAGIQWYTYPNGEAYLNRPSILAIIKEAGYVKLADNQMLYHTNEFDKLIPNSFEQEATRRGWRKVELEVKVG